MSGWDTSVDRDRYDQESSELINNRPSIKYSAESARVEFREFIRKFSDDGGKTFPYRQQLTNNFLQGQHYLIVDLKEFSSLYPILSHLLIESPSIYIPILESAATEVARISIGQRSNEDPALLANDSAESARILALSLNVQIQLKNFDSPVKIRSLSSEHVSKLVTVKGIVISAGRPRVKPTRLHIMCRNCKTTKTIPCSLGFGGAKLPRQCDHQPLPGLDQIKCPLDPYQILADTSTYIDQQRLKLQEVNEDIPTGELPRHLTVAIERYLVGAVKPGSRVSVIGMYTTYETKMSGNEASQLSTGDVGIRIPYLRAFGLKLEDSDNNSSMYNDDEEEMKAFAATPNLYERIAASMCPAIFDNEDTRNIKKSLAVQLFGGSRKILPDGMRLRGDINMLLLGDPSVAKSQFLKFVSAAAPVGVYTSGKGSSAAGLTASVIRDPGSGEFHLEGGALVLADGGLVAIDEFDKMREQDRVAIHEAMEQQTISIAKAGITTILNSRTSVLAAANPIFGRYDDMRSPTENIDFQTSILSRFDLIYIVRDIQDEERDTNLARHVLNVHRYKETAREVTKTRSGEDTIPIDLLKRYISYARRTCTPRLSEQSALTLTHQYVKMRQTVAAQENGAGQVGNVIPITVRQLEAIIRISEALARMELSEQTTPSHVHEAIRLFTVSTYRAATTSSHTTSDHVNATSKVVGTAEFDNLVALAEKVIGERVKTGSSISYASLLNYLSTRQISKVAAVRAIQFMLERRNFIATKGGAMLERVQ